MIWRDQDAAMFFQTHYVMWTVGMIDPDFVADLDALSPPTHENWRHVMQRECPWSRAEIQNIFARLCVEMTDEEALETILRDLSLTAT
jgi:hypothetical protein